MSLVPDPSTTGIPPDTAPPPRAYDGTSPFPPEASVPVCAASWAG